MSEGLAPPVEYAVAVDRYLAAARISVASQRVYRVALNTWAWLLVGRTPPTGPDRRGARPPSSPLSLLDGSSTTTLMHAALDHRAPMVDRRTFEREASILRNAAHWWSAQGWIGTELEKTVKEYTYSEIEQAEDTACAVDVRGVLSLHAPLREQALWHLVYESAAPVEHLLALNVSDLDINVPHRRVRRSAVPRQADRISWGEETGELLTLLTIGRTTGPIFLTERRAPARTPAADRCPYTGRARLSTRRAAELFQSATMTLDPRGAGWNLRDLRLAGRQAGAGCRAHMRT